MGYTIAEKQEWGSLLDQLFASCVLTPLCVYEGVNVVCVGLVDELCSVSFGSGKNALDCIVRESGTLELASLDVSSDCVRRFHAFACLWSVV